MYFERVKNLWVMSEWSIATQPLTILPETFEVVKKMLHQTLLICCKGIEIRGNILGYFPSSS